MKAPKFRLVYCSPKVRSTRRSNHTIRTKAYAIETLRKDREEMNRILKQAYKDTGTFIPFQMRSRHPEAFEKMIRAQTHHMANNFVIILNYVGPDVMHYISERILTTDGVEALLPCKSVNEDGKYKVLVEKDKYHKTRGLLMDELTNWITNDAAPDAKVTLLKYPSPPEIAPIGSDGFSRGDQSYMNISVNTALSVGSTLSDASPPSYVYNKSAINRTNSSEDSTSGGSQAILPGNKGTWADTVAGRSTSLSINSDIGSTGIDQTTIISDLESSRAEVETLKSKVAQMEAERAEQQRVLAETVQEHVSKALQDQMMIFTNQMTQMFANLASTLKQTPEGIPKRTAQDMESSEELNTENHEVTLTGTASKRWDNKKSPSKQRQKASNLNRRYGLHSESTPQQKIHIQSEQDTTSPVATQPTVLFAEAGVAINMSQSDDEDIIMHDSGNESIHKSSNNQGMASEAEQNRKNG